MRNREQRNDCFFIEDREDLKDPAKTMESRNAHYWRNGDRYYAQLDWNDLGSIMSSIEERLSRRQLDILLLRAQGKSYEQIASMLHNHTAERETTHRVIRSERTALRKIGVGSVSLYGRSPGSINSVLKRLSAA